MCGLFGYYLTDDVDRTARAAMLAVLALSNDGRGGDSWGWWIPDGETPPVRGLGRMVTPTGTPATTLSQHPVVCCHTRYATAGKVTIDNAHPFRAGTITGAHNGAIYNAWELDQRHGRRCAVDSWHLIKHLAGGLDTGELHGYGAVVWTDTREPGAVYLSRMADGELAVASIQGGIVWSSDSTHLVRALAAGGITGSYMQLRKGRIYCISGGVLRRTGGRIPTSLL